MIRYSSILWKENVLMINFTKGFGCSIISAKGFQKRSELSAFIENPKAQMKPIFLSKLFLQQSKETANDWRFNSQSENVTTTTFCDFLQN